LSKRQGNTFGRSSVFEKDSSFPLHTRIEKDSLQPSERGLNMETREVRYGKAVAQFTVWTLYATLDAVWMPPREI
jgi:hypothetical protein